MKRTASFFLVLALLLGLILTGCGTSGSLAGTVGADGEACDLQEGQLTLYMNAVSEGVFTFAKAGDGWTISSGEGQYIALSAEDGSVVTGSDAFVWSFADGAFSAVSGDGTVYLGSGLTASAEKPGTSFAPASENAFYRYVMLEDKPASPTPTPTPTPKPTATPKPTPTPKPVAATAVPTAESGHSTLTADSVASVKISGSMRYYDSFGEAWTAANAAPASAFVVVTLLKDVTALDGKLTVTDRTSWLVLDLNEHTLSRGLTSPVESGEVFSLNHAGYITIKNGTITGGNSANAGGGIWVNSDNMQLYLENLTITGNCSANAGGGVYIEGCSADVFMTNVTVTGNTCTGNGAGGIHWCSSGDKMAALTLGGRVTVYDNSASNCCDDLMAMTYPSGTCKLAFDELRTDSKIGMAFEYNAEGTITEGLGDEAEALAGCFVNEAGYTLQITARDGKIFFEGSD